MGEVRKSKSVRLNITLPDTILEQIDETCQMYGLTRSAFILQCCMSKLNSDKVLSQMPDMFELSKKLMEMKEMFENVKPNFDLSDGSKKG